MTPGRGEGGDSTVASATAAVNRIREEGPGMQGAMGRWANPTTVGDTEEGEEQRSNGNRVAKAAGVTRENGGQPQRQ